MGTDHDNLDVAAWKSNTMHIPIDGRESLGDRVVPKAIVKYFSHVVLCHAAVDMKFFDIARVG